MAENMIEENSTICGQDSLLVEKIKDISALINITQSRITFLEARIREVNETQRGNVPQNVLDITNMISGCKGKINELWNAIENLQLKAAGLKTLQFNTIARPLLSIEKTGQLDSEQLSIPGSGKFVEDILSGGNRLATVSVEHQKLCRNQETEEEAYIKQQQELLGLIANVGGKTEEIKELKGKQLKKMKGKVDKTKIARTMINSFLSNVEIDFEQHPELLELKAYWRQPL